jgi:hypothetical protein
MPLHGHMLTLLDVTFESSFELYLARIHRHFDDHSSDYWRDISNDSISRRNGLLLRRNRNGCPKKIAIVGSCLEVLSVRCESFRAARRLVNANVLTFNSSVDFTNVKDADDFIRHIELVNSQKESRSEITADSAKYVTVT